LHFSYNAIVIPVNGAWNAILAADPLNNVLPPSSLDLWMILDIMKDKKKQDKPNYVS